jgi:PEP-CTERM motif
VPGKEKKSMKAIKGVCWLLVLGVLALPALAARVNMQFTGLPTGANYWGVASYPYNISVNGGANQWMMCIGYYEHIEGWETWQAKVSNVGSLDPATDLVYYQAAFLFKMAAADGGVDPNINAATWYLLEGAPGLTTEAAALVALAQNQSYAVGEFDDVLLYSAIPGTESGNLGTAQDFLAATPEPGTLMMFGSGMIGLAGLMRRKFRP